VYGNSRTECTETAGIGVRKRRNTHHSDPTTTLRIYTKVREESMKAAAAAADLAFGAAAADRVNVG
jgi:hypothetical protein